MLSLAGGTLQACTIEDADALAIDGDDAGLAHLPQGSGDGLAIDAQALGDFFMRKVFDAIRLGTFEEQTGDARQQVAKGGGCSSRVSSFGAADDANTRGLGGLGRAVIHALADEGHLAEDGGRLELGENQFVSTRGAEGLHLSSLREKQALACLAGPEEDMADTKVAHLAAVFESMQTGRREALEEIDCRGRGGCEETRGRIGAAARHGRNFRILLV
jgi:hypothetical protein